MAPLHGHHNCICSRYILYVCTPGKGWCEARENDTHLSTRILELRGRKKPANDYCCCCYTVLRILGLSHRSAHLLPHVRPRQACPGRGSFDVGCCDPLLWGEFVRSHCTNGRYSVKG